MDLADMENLAQRISERTKQILTDEFSDELAGIDRFAALVIFTTVFGNLMAVTLARFCPDEMREERIRAFIRELRRGVKAEVRRARKSAQVGLSS